MFLFNIIVIFFIFFFLIKKPLSKDLSQAQDSKLFAIYEDIRHLSCHLNKKQLSFNFSPSKKKQKLNKLVLFFLH